MECILLHFNGLAPILLLFFCTCLPVSTNYTKYVREGDSLGLECISDYDDKSYTIMWLQATTYWRPSGKLLSKNGVLDDQNTDNRFKIEVHQITATRKRYFLTIAVAERSDDAVYWCVALPKHNNATDIVAINKQGTDLTGDIYVTVEYHPGPEDPICLNETTANNQVTLLCCHGFATPFPVRKWLLMNGTELKDTKRERMGNQYCLAVNISAYTQDTHVCQLTSGPFPNYVSICEYNPMTPETTVLPTSKFVQNGVNIAAWLVPVIVIVTLVILILSWYIKKTMLLI